MGVVARCASKPKEKLLPVGKLFRPGVAVGVIDTDVQIALFGKELAFGCRRVRLLDDALQVKG